MASTYRAIVTKCNRLQCITALNLCLQNIFTALSMPSEHLQTLSISVIVVIVIQQWPIFGCPDPIEIEIISMTHSKTKSKPEISMCVYSIYSPLPFHIVRLRWNPLHVLRCLFVLASWVCCFTKSQCGCWWCLCFLSLTRYVKYEMLHFFSLANVIFRGHLVGFGLFEAEKINCVRCKYIQRRRRNWGDDT